MTLLLERSAGSGSVDWQNHVIRRVKIIGLESKNGYDYSPGALQDAAHLYEGVSVNIDHPDFAKATAGRGVMEAPGWLENITFEGDGLYGDLHLFENHPATLLLMERAERNPQGFGLSHNADGKLDKVNGRKTITKISEVRSVDLVGGPATTGGLFESVGRSDYERLRARLLIESRGGKMPAHLAEGEYERLRAGLGR